MSVRPLKHPEMASVALTDVLHALADPDRLAIVAALDDARTPLNCVETMERVGRSLPKSTCSQHYVILREAGLIWCERKGVELESRLRTAELDRRFPGLLRSILKAWRLRTTRDPGPSA